MKHNFFNKKYFLIAMLLISSFILTSCSNEKNDIDETISNKINETTSNKKYLNESQLYFASHCDCKKIENYFKEKGTAADDYYQIVSSKDYQKICVQSAIRYYPKNQEFVIGNALIETSADSYTGIVYQYTSAASIKVKINQNLTGAKYSGSYSHEGLGVTSNASAFYDASFSFDKIKFLSTDKLCEFDYVYYDGNVTYANNWSTAKSAFDRQKSEIAKKVYERFDSCLSYVSNLLKEIDGTYEIAGTHVSQADCAHNKVIDKGYEATCQKEGLSEGSHCTKCHYIFKEQQIIPIVECKATIVKGYDAICDTAGLTDGSKCLWCEKTLVEQQIIKENHNYTNGKCSRCNKLKPSQGLEFQETTLMSEKCYKVVGMGICSDSFVVIPETYNGLPVKIIGHSAFEGYYISKVFMPDSIEKIESRAFAECSKLEEVTFSNSLKEIDVYAFYNCSKLNAFNLPNTIERINYDAFRKTGYYDNENNWENDILYIGKYLIKANRSFSGEYTIRNNTLLIANEAFKGCKNITKITVNSGLKFIGSYSLAADISLLELPSSVVSVGDTAFGNYYWGSVENITYSGTRLQWEEISGSIWVSDVDIYCTDGVIK